MQAHTTHRSGYTKFRLKSIITPVLIAISCLTTTGCFRSLFVPSQKLHSGQIPIEVSDHRAKETNYSKVEITSQDVSEGLKQLCLQMEKELGQFNSQALILDYTPVIQKALYGKGFCTIQHLGINNVDVTIDSFFIIEGGLQPSLTIRAFFNNSNKPSFQVTNHYFIASH